MAKRSEENASKTTSFIYSVEQTYFWPDIPPTDGKTFDFISTDLGLRYRDYITDSEFDPDDKLSQWNRFQRYVEFLNEEYDPPNVQHKVLYLGRHGEGWHNVAERKYGRAEWDASWAMTEGDGEFNWVDATLTKTGKQQAQAAHKFWEEGLKRGIPPPDRYYSSPLYRCLQTVNMTFSDLSLPKDKPFKVLVKENLRETIGKHLCDRWSSLTKLKTVISESAINFEPGFTEEDLLWKAEIRESDQETQDRVRKVLDEIFANDSGTWISLTGYSGTVRAILAVICHREFRLAQGSMMAVLVKAQEVESEP